MGFPIQQCPFDLQRYQELIHARRPRAIVQTGVNQGGSLLFLAQMLDAVENPNDDAIVIGIDIQLSAKAKELKHPRIHLIEGDSKSLAVVTRARQLVGERAPVLVSLDSDHRCEHVLGELHAFAPFIGPGGALVVEDTNVNGHPVLPLFGPGPREAVDQWLPLSSGDFIETGANGDPNWLSFHTWFERR
jgi:cephalosporin hydroxylase